MPPELPELCYEAFQSQDRLSRGALDAAQCRAAFGELLRGLFPEGAPRPSPSMLLDRAFSEADQDLDGLLRLSEFSIFAARALQPMLRSSHEAMLKLPAFESPRSQVKREEVLPEAREACEAEIKGQAVQGLKDWLSDLSQSLKSYT